MSGYGTVVRPFICFGDDWDTGVYITEEGELGYTVDGEVVSFTMFILWCTRKGKLNGLGILALRIRALLEKV